MNRKCSEGFKKTQKCQWYLILVLLRVMSESSDYKPVVPVVGFDNVLKSFNPAAHTREHRSLGYVCMCICRLNICSHLYIYTLAFVLHVCALCALC